MVDPKDPKDLNKPAPAVPQGRQEKDQIADEDLDKVSGGMAICTITPTTPPPGRGCVWVVGQGWLQP
jgi:hypothetical protein